MLSEKEINTVGPGCSPQKKCSGVVLMVAAAVQPERDSSVAKRMQQQPQQQLDLRAQLHPTISA